MHVKFVIHWQDLGCWRFQIYCYSVASFFFCMKKSNNNKKKVYRSMLDPDSILVGNDGTVLNLHFLNDFLLGVLHVISLLWGFFGHAFPRIPPASRFLSSGRRLGRGSRHKRCPFVRVLIQVFNRVQESFSYITKKTLPMKTSNNKTNSNSTIA